MKRGSLPHHVKVSDRPCQGFDTVMKVGHSQLLLRTRWRSVPISDLLIVSISIIWSKFSLFIFNPIERLAGSTSLNTNPDDRSAFKSLSPMISMMAANEYYSRIQLGTNEDEEILGKAQQVYHPFLLLAIYLN